MHNNSPERVIDRVSPLGAGIYYINKQANACLYAPQPGVQITRHQLAVCDIIGSGSLHHACAKSHAHTCQARPEGGEAQDIVAVA